MHPGGRPSDKPRSSLGERLAKARERAGISQVELAERMGTSQQTVAYWERKAVSLRSDVIIQLAEILDISADELLGTGKRPNRAAKPSGKARQLFDAVSKLPRRQQEKIIAVLEPFVNEHASES
jgi:transcriptional regulator with XRE-family HTH domain